MPAVNGERRRSCDRDLHRSDGEEPRPRGPLELRFHANPSSVALERPELPKNQPERRSRPFVRLRLSTALIQSEGQERGRPTWLLHNELRPVCSSATVDGLPRDTPRFEAWPTGHVASAPYIVRPMAQAGAAHPAAARRRNGRARITPSFGGVDTLRQRTICPHLVQGPPST